MKTIPRFARSANDLKETYRPNFSANLEGASGHAFKRAANRRETTALAAEVLASPGSSDTGTSGVKTPSVPLSVWHG